MNTTSIIPVMDKLVIYQIFTRLFGNRNTNNQPWGSRDENGVGKLNDISQTALHELKIFGASHIWYTGVIEHALMTDYSAEGIHADDPSVVKGRAGSPYAIKDYYDINPDLAVEVPNRMAEFEALVERTHAAGLKVIIDFVPNHVARQYQSDAKPAGVVDLGERDNTTVNFSPSNNYYYLPGQSFRAPTEGSQYQENPAKVTGNDAITATPSLNDWYETIKLNYGVDIFNGYKTHFKPVPATWQQMLDILLFWTGKGVDGFRCDMAHMVPVEFWGWATKQVKQRQPDLIFIAEIYDPGLYHRYIREGGFDYLYDKVGLYDALRRLMEGHGSCYDISRVWQQESGDIGNHMLRFLENHDEQRIASPQFAGTPWAAIPAITLAATLHTGPLMLYFGQEIGVRAEGSEGFSGNDGRTTIFDYWGIPEWQGWINARTTGDPTQRLGRYDGGGLTPEQRQLRGFYQQLNHLVNGSDAIQSGGFYDLQWANEHNWGYYNQWLYSYLRYTDRQKLLIICNFNKEVTYETVVKVPDHAWQTMGLDPNHTYRFSDVFLSQRAFEAHGLSGVHLTIGPLGVLVLEIR